MAKTSKAETKVKFALEEIILSFVGSLILALGIVVIGSSGGNFWANFVLGIFVIWLGLLLFIMPLVRKIEQLM